MFPCTYTHRVHNPIPLPFWLSFQKPKSFKRTHQLSCTHIYTSFSYINLPFPLAISLLKPISVSSNTSFKFTIFFPTYPPIHPSLPEYKIIHTKPYSAPSIPLNSFYALPLSFPSSHTHPFPKYFIAYLHLPLPPLHPTPNPPHPYLFHFLGTLEDP